MPSIVDGASFASGPIATDSIASIFGSRLAADTVVNTSNPPPTTLGGVTAERSSGSPASIRVARLFRVSPRSPKIN